MSERSRPYPGEYSGRKEDLPHAPQTIMYRQLYTFTSTSVHHILSAFINFLPLTNVESRKPTCLMLYTPTNHSAFRRWRSISEASHPGSGEDFAAKVPSQTRESSIHWTRIDFTCRGPLGHALTKEPKPLATLQMRLPAGFTSQHYNGNAISSGNPITAFKSKPRQFFTQCSEGDDLITA